MVANTLNFEKKCDVITFSDIQMDLNRFETKIKGVTVYLTYTEFKLLQYLIEHSERAISREELLKEIWMIPQTIETRATDDMIKRLRKKLKKYKTEAKIMTVRGFGFILDEPRKSTKLTWHSESELYLALEDFVSGSFDTKNEVTLKIIKKGSHYVINVIS